MSEPTYRLAGEHLFSMRATLASPPQSIGPVPEGIRVNFYVTGGRVEGLKLNGEVLPVGGDWFTLRPDGVGLLDVQVTIETADGGLIHARYHGQGDFGEDGYARFLKGVLPKKVDLRTAPQLRTAHPDYQWLNRMYCVGLGEADLEAFEVRYDIYAL